VEEIYAIVMYLISLFYVTIDMLPKYFIQYTICHFLTGKNPPKDNAADVTSVCTVMSVMFYVLVHLNVYKYSNPPPLRLK